MIILRQKNYSWDEIKRATKSIGRGALIGAGTGAFLGRRQLTKKDNPKGFLIRTGIGAVVGAGIGIAAYNSGHKGRLIRKRVKEIENKLREEKYLENNLPKFYYDLIPVKKEIDKLNKLIRERNKVYEEDAIIDFNLYKLDKDSEDYIDNMYYEYASLVDDGYNEFIPLFTCTDYFWDDHEGFSILYNTENKKFYDGITPMIEEAKPIKKSIKLMLFDQLEYLKGSIIECIKAEDNPKSYIEKQDLQNLKDYYDLWMKEYYEKIKIIFNKIHF